MPTINLRDEDVDIGDADFSSASAGGDSFENNGNTCLLIKNEDAVQHTITVTATGHCDQDFLHNLVITVAAGAVRKTRVFPRTRFGGRSALTYDGVTALKLVAVRQGAYVG